MHVLLIGPRGSGKSTIGRELAAQLGCTFIDLDELVLQAFDQPSVAAIWSTCGESAWREQEASTLQQVMAHHRDEHLVIALGGGTPMIDDAATAIRLQQQQGSVRVVYLRCPAALLVQRLTESPGDRPPLHGSQSLAEEVEETLQQREPTYLDMADVVVQIEPDQRQQVIVEQVLTAVRKRN